MKTCRRYTYMKETYFFSMRFRQTMENVLLRLHFEADILKFKQFSFLRVILNYIYVCGEKKTDKRLKSL